MQYNTDELLEEYGKQLENFSKAVYNDFLFCLTLAKGGDIHAQRQLKATICWLKLEKIVQKFNDEISACEFIHSNYERELEALKQVMWGQPETFRKLIEVKNNKYLSHYKSAMSLKKEYISISNERISLLKVFYRKWPSGKNIENEKVDIKYKELEFDEELKSKTNAEVIKEEQGNLEKIVKDMENQISVVRKDMNNDINDSKIAIEAVEMSVPSTKSNSQEQF